MYPSPAGASREAVIGVADASGVAAARRRAAALTREAGFGEAEAGRVAIVVTEAATNLLKHGNGGEILLQAGFSWANDVYSGDGGSSAEPLQALFERPDLAGVRMTRAEVSGGCALASVPAGGSSAGWLALLPLLGLTLMRRRRR